MDGGGLQEAKIVTQNPRGRRVVGGRADPGKGRSQGSGEVFCQRTSNSLHWMEFQGVNSRGKKSFWAFFRANFCAIFEAGSLAFEAVYTSIKYPF